MRLSERQYLASEKRQIMHIARCCHYLALCKAQRGTVLQTVVPHTHNPGTVSRATTASLSTALQAGRGLRQICAGISPAVMQYLESTRGSTRYCLTDSPPHTPNPGTVSRATNAALSTALQAGHCLRQICADFTLQAGHSLRQTCAGISAAISEERDQPVRLY